MTPFDPPHRTRRPLHRPWARTAWGRFWQRSWGIWLFGAALLTTVAIALLPVAAESALGQSLVYLLLAIPLAVPAGLLAARAGSAAARQLAERLRLRRARAVFRLTLKVARRHPELVDLDALREAAAVLAIAPESERFPEVAEAARHPYAPIRNTACIVLQASAVTAATTDKSPRTEPRA